MAYIQKIENLNPKWIPSLNKELSISQNKKAQTNVAAKCRRRQEGAFI